MSYQPGEAEYLNGKDDGREPWRSVVSYHPDDGEFVLGYTPNGGDLSRHHAIVQYITQSNAYVQYPGMTPISITHWQELTEPTQ